MTAFTIIGCSSYFNIRLETKTYQFWHKELLLYTCYSILTCKGDQISGKAKEMAMMKKMLEVISLPYSW